MTQTDRKQATASLCRGGSQEKWSRSIKKNEAAFLTDLSLWPELIYLLLYSILMGAVESWLPEAFLESPEWKHSLPLSVPRCMVALAANSVLHRTLSTESETKSELPLNEWMM